MMMDIGYRQRLSHNQRNWIKICVYIYIFMRWGMVLPVDGSGFRARWLLSVTRQQEVSFFVIEMQMYVSAGYWLLIHLCSVSCFAGYAFQWRAEVSHARSRLQLNQIVSSTANANTGPRPLPRQDDRKAPSETRYRFWSRRLRWMDEKERRRQPDQLASTLQTMLAHDGINIDKIEMGLALVPELGLAVPIHEGMVQQQHIVRYQDAQLDNQTSSLQAEREGGVMLFSFSPRAQHTMVAPSEEERPVDEERLEVLSIALKQFYNISQDELMSEALAGTSPAR
jgi:hypothetical protein